MKILFQGQLQTAAQQAVLEMSIQPDETLRDVIGRAAASLPEAAQQLILNADGAVRTSLFVATDGEHTRDLNRAATATELLLMPPMAGG